MNEPTIYIFLNGFILTQNIYKQSDKENEGERTNEEGLRKRQRMSHLHKGWAWTHDTPSSLPHRWQGPEHFHWFPRWISREVDSSPRMDSLEKR